MFEATRNQHAGGVLKSPSVILPASGSKSREHPDVSRRKLVHGTLPVVPANDDFNSVNATGFVKRKTDRVLGTVFVTKKHTDIAHESDGGVLHWVLCWLPRKRLRIRDLCWV